MNVVDLGCGDFNVGSRLVDYSLTYTACDIVPLVIERNAARFRGPNLRLFILNAIEDDLPDGDVVCIRQVLQHLANADLAKIVRKMGRYRHWIVTEHIPAGDFVANRDKQSSGTFRLAVNGSGVVLTAPPFNVRPSISRILCEVECPSGRHAGVLRTTAYSFS